MNPDAEKAGSVVKETAMPPWYGRRRAQIAMAVTAIALVITAIALAIAIPLSNNSSSSSASKGTRHNLNYTVRRHSVSSNPIHVTLSGFCAATVSWV